MIILQPSTANKKHLSGSILTLGNFDGLHKGHQKLIQFLCQLSLERKKPSVLVTFFPHPSMVLNPKSEALNLLSFEDFKTELGSLGLQFLMIENFTRSLSQKEHHEYLKDHLVACFHPKVIVVGENFCFGRNKEGNTAFLKKWEKKYEYELKEFPLLKLKGDVVSSSKIRNCLKSGDVEEAQSLLGRPYFIRGPVVKGEGRGKQIDYPTLNVKVESQLIPLFGVYFTFLVFQGKTFKSVTNIGKNPTFGGEETKIETHILYPEEQKKNWPVHSPFYREEILICFQKFLRPEKKFKDIPSLQRQIKSDIDQARNFHFHHNVNGI